MADSSKARRLIISPSPSHQDMFIILFSSLGRCLRLRGSPSSSGYTRADGGRGGFIGAISGRGSGSYSRRRDVDAENRLIDQLDEEWED